MNTTKLRNPDLRKLRALRIIEARIGGLSLKQIGGLLNIEAQTVTDELEWAKKQGLLASLENRILEELAPAAISAIKKSLDNNDVATGLEVLRGTGLLRKIADRPIQQLPTAGGGDETLEVHVKRINRSAAQVEASGTPGAQLRSAGESPAISPAPLEAELVAHRSEAGEANPDGPVDLDGYVEHLVQQPTES